MFNDSMRGVSTLSYALFNSVKDMIVRNNIDEVKDDSVQFINNNGDIYIPYQKAYDPAGTGENKFPRFIPGGIENNPNFGESVYFQDFKRNYINSEITTLTYDRSISMPVLLKQLAEEDSIYGVVLQKKGTDSRYAINPLHPMVAFLVTAGLLELPEEGKLHIFEWKDSKVKSILKKMDKPSEIREYISDYEKFFGLSAEIIRDPVTVRQRANINDHNITSLIEDPFIENINAKIKITKDDTGQSDLDKIKSMVIPHQIIVDGTLSPFYGISCIKQPTNSNIRGVALGPMVTGNISQCHDGGQRTFKNFQNSANTCNVCTGSENSVTPKGWFTLSRVNLNSMYYSDVISKDYVFPFIKASKQIAADIWKVQVEEEEKQLEEETA
jgi:hypothetical protein